MTHSAAPALDANDIVALVDDTELEAVVDTPLEAAVHVLLPDLDVEIRLGLREGEGPNPTVQVGIPRSSGVAGNHEDGANRAVFGEETSSVTTNLVSRGLSHMITTTPNRSAYLVVKTRMAPALSSKLALTAAMAMDSTVAVGRGARLRNSSKTLK